MPAPATETGSMKQCFSHASASRQPPATATATGSMKQCLSHASASRQRHIQGSMKPCLSQFLERFEEMTGDAPVVSRGSKCGGVLSVVFFAVGNKVRRRSEASTAEVARDPRHEERSVHSHGAVYGLGSAGKQHQVEHGTQNFKRARSEHCRLSQLTVTTLGRRRVSRKEYSGVAPK
jgi:hypothetical protein